MQRSPKPIEDLEMFLLLFLLFLGKVETAEENPSELSSPIRLEGDVLQEQLLDLLSHFLEETEAVLAIKVSHQLEEVVADVVDEEGVLVILGLFGVFSLLWVGTLYDPNSLFEVLGGVEDELLLFGQLQFVTLQIDVADFGG